MTARARRAGRRAAAAALGVLLTTTPSGCAGVLDTVRPPAPAAPQGPSGTAARALAGLQVTVPHAMAGYSRARFGRAWADTDHNGCSQREDVLARDLIRGVRAAGSGGDGGCEVVSRLLEDPYTGRQVVYRHGRRSSSAVQIDHVVALADAWRSGAWAWSLARREAYATDEDLVLLAVDGPTNESKGDQPASSWLPPAAGYRCAYVARQVAIKTRYQLTVTAGEHDAIAAVLAGCPGQPLPAGGGR